MKFVLNKESWQNTGDLARQIDPGVIPRVVLFLSTVFLLLRFAPAIAPLFYIGLAVYALRGPKAVIQALTLLFLLLHLNQGIYPTYSAALTLRWLVLLSAFSRLMWDSFFQSPSSAITVIRPIIIYAGVASVLAIISSYALSVSILKLVMFAVGSSSVLLGFYRTPQLKHYWISWFVSVFFFICVISIPLYRSELGYFINGVGFQGILRHPQTFGPFVVPVTVLFSGLYLFRSNHSPIVIAGAIIGWVAIITSAARTALVMSVLSIALAVLLGLIFRQSWRAEIAHAISLPKILFSLLLIGVIAVLRGPDLVDFATDFVYKGETEESLSESFEGSRGFLIQRQMEHFREAPLTGIGFGMPSDPSALIVQSGSLGLPSGASAEKGFMPSAVLEETGILGAILVLVLFLALIRPVFTRGDVIIFSVLLSSLLVNLGEMIFFSVGGLGLYFWLIIGLCHNVTLKYSSLQPRGQAV